LWRWVDGVTELGLLAVVNGEALEQERAETGACATTDGVEDEEALETSAVVGELADAIQAKINDFLSDGIMATCVIVGRIFLSGDELLWVEELAVCAGADFVDDGWLEVEHHAAWHVLAGASFGEESVVGVIFDADCLVGWHRAVWLNAVLQAEQFPTCVTSLNTSLTDVDGNDFAHCVFVCCFLVDFFFFWFGSLTQASFFCFVFLFFVFQQNNNKVFFFFFLNS
jgi:hypothetical protein